MGKANRQKVELFEDSELLVVVETLKDIADRKLFLLLNDKDKFKRFSETFVEFFTFRTQFLCHWNFFTSANSLTHVSPR